MLPPAFDLDAVLGAVTDRGGDGPERRAFEGDIERDLARLIAHRRAGLARGDGDARDQPGGDHRAAQIRLEALLKQVALIEPGHAREVPARKELGIAADHAPEHIFAARLDRECQIALGPRVVDQQFGIGDFGKGITALSECNAQFELALDDPVGIEWIAGGNRENFPQALAIGRGQ